MFFHFLNSLDLTVFESNEIRIIILIRIDSDKITLTKKQHTHTDTINL